MTASEAGSLVRGERDRDLHRMLTFIDAAVAIALTLLVLPLVELTSEAGGAESVSTLLRENQAELWSFLLSFAVIWQFWLGQHHALSTVVRPHPALSRLLLLWTLTIVFLPFPTALIGEADEDTTTKLLYVGTLILSSLWVALMNLLIRDRPEITDGGDRRDPRPAFVTVVLLVVALVIMVVLPATSYVPLLLLFLTGPVLTVATRLGL